MMMIQMGAVSRTRALLVVCLLAGLIVFTLLHQFQQPPTPPPVPSQYGGLGPGAAASIGGDLSYIPHGISAFEPDQYKKHLVIPKMSGEVVSWSTQLPAELNITPKIYLVDEENPPVGALTTPVNKGHEVLVYLTYIIDHYDALADIIIFIHAHAAAWHNNDLQLSATPVMLIQMNYLRVIRHGYMNLRCHWHPGCPAWIKPTSAEMDINKQEEVFLRDAFQELFPNEAIPDILATACCAQFAVTNDTVLAHPKELYIRWRQWVIDTQLDDDISGRIWEYLWQYVFPGPARMGSPDQKAVCCPREHVCYCDGYGYCFGGEEQYNEFFNMRKRATQLRERLRLAQKETAFNSDLRRGVIDKAKAELKELDNLCDEQVAKARVRGKDPAQRKLELGIEFSG